MHVNEFHVVLVDDEPDVHEISRLAMRQFRVYGLPVRLHSAHSKAEGIEVLNRLSLGRPDISLASVALIDVVMETDHAGLELCDYIRNEMKNRMLQIFVRTGQPGVAPERSVIDRYDIQGYVAKSEATEDKLYTLVKAGIREAYFGGISHALQDLIRYLIPHAGSRSAMAEALRNWQQLTRVDSGGSKAPTVSASLCYFGDGEYIAGVDQYADAAAAKIAVHGPVFHKQAAVLQAALRAGEHVGGGAHYVHLVTQAVFGKQAQQSTLIAQIVGLAAASDKRFRRIE